MTKNGPGFWTSWSRGQGLSQSIRQQRSEDLARRARVAQRQLAEEMDAWRAVFRRIQNNLVKFRGVLIHFFIDSVQKSHVLADLGELLEEVTLGFGTLEP